MELPAFGVVVFSADPVPPRTPDRVQLTMADKVSASVLSASLVKYSTTGMFSWHMGHGQVQLYLAKTTPQQTVQRRSSMNINIIPGIIFWYHTPIIVL